MSEGHGATPLEGDHHDETPTPFILWLGGNVAKGVAGAPFGVSLNLEKGGEHANDNHAGGEAEHHDAGGGKHLGDAEHPDTGGEHKEDASHGASGHGTTDHGTADPHKGEGASDGHHKEGSEGGDPHKPDGGTPANDNSAQPPGDAHGAPPAAHSSAA